jgi:hypothetical protein
VKNPSNALSARRTSGSGESYRCILRDAEWLMKGVNCNQWSHPHLHLRNNHNSLLHRLLLRLSLNKKVKVKLDQGVKEKKMKIPTEMRMKNLSQ